MRLILNYFVVKYYIMVNGKIYKRRNRRPLRASGTRSIKKTVKKAVRGAKQATFARRVRAVINKVSETKCVNYSIPNKSCYNVSSADWAGSVLNLLPEAAGSSHTCYTIPQGVNQGDRIGNEIRPCKLVISGVVRCNQFYDATLNYNPCPLRVTVWLVKLKNHLTDSITNLESVVDNTFFQLGDISSGFLGTTVDLTRTPNKDQIVVLMKRSFYVGMGNYVSSFGVNAPNNGSQQYNQDGATMSRMFRMDLTKYLPKRLQFNDGSDTPVNARKMWLMVTTQRADGNLSQTSASNLTGPIPAYLDLSSDFHFKDI